MTSFTLFGWPSPDELPGFTFDPACLLAVVVPGFGNGAIPKKAAMWPVELSPTSWRVAFDAAARRRPIVLQHLLLGMNAHINLDLGVTAATFAGPEGLATVRRDFDAINRVLADLVDGRFGRETDRKLRATATCGIGLLAKLTAEVPGEIAREIDRIVRDGWFPDQETVVREALSQFVDGKSFLGDSPRLLHRFGADAICVGSRGHSVAAAALLGTGAYCVESGADGTAFEYYYALGLAAPTVTGVVTQGSCP